MPQFDETALEKRATEVVTRYLTEKVALTDGVTDVAMQDNLNPEQLKRLVETVNNMTFLKKFEGAPDRVAASEFEPADADAALNRIVDQAGQEPSGSHGDRPPTEHAEVPGGVSSAEDFAAALPNSRPETQPLPPPPPPDPLAPMKVSSARVLIGLRKTAEQLRDERYQAQYRFTDTFQKLATHFTRVRNADAFEEFERDALYKHGHSAVTHLGALRAVLRKPSATYDGDYSTKVARVIDSRSPTLQMFSNLLGYSDAMLKTAAAETRAQEYIKRAEAAAK